MQLGSEVRLSKTETLFGLGSRPAASPCGAGRNRIQRSKSECRNLFHVGRRQRQKEGGGGVLPLGVCQTAGSWAGHGQDRRRVGRGLGEEGERIRVGAVRGLGAGLTAESGPLPSGVAIVSDTLTRILLNVLSFALYFQ